MRFVVALLALTLSSAAFAAPDLIPQSVSVIKKADGYHVYVTVKNNSAEAAAGPYYVDLFQNLAAPPAMGTVSATYKEMPSMPAWGVAKAEFVFQALPDNRWYDALVDTDEIVPESNEANNHIDYRVP
jgi:hypothetical protein